MTEHIYALITVAVLAALSEMISAGGKMTGHVRFLTGICVLVALLSPIKEGMARLLELSEGIGEMALPEDRENRYEACFRDSITEITQEKCEAWVIDTLTREFAISPEDCAVTVILREGGDVWPAISSVEIILSGKAIFKDPRAVEVYVAKALSAACTVTAVPGSR